MGGTSNSVGFGWPHSNPRILLQNYCGKLNLNEEAQGLCQVAAPGWDLSLFSPLAGKVLGSDISPTAIAEASRINAHYPNVSCLVSDFFDHQFTDENRQRFKSVYDHTFFCAIKPTQRALWAKQMDRIVEPNGMIPAGYFPNDRL